MRRALKYFVESVAATIAVAVVLVVFLIWRLSVEPISSTYLTPYVQSGLSYLFPQASSEIKGTLLVWDNKDNTIALQGDRVTLRDRTGDVIASFPVLKIKFSIWGLLCGRLIPAELNIEHPRLNFERHADGAFVFGEDDKGNRAEKAESADDRADNENTINIVESTGGLLKELAGDRALSEITVDDAELVVVDAVNNQNWVLRAPSIRLLRRRQGLAGYAEANLLQGDKSVNLRIDYQFDRDSGLHSASVQFSDLNPASFLIGQQNVASLASMFNLPLSGKINVSLDNQLNIATAGASISGADGSLLVPALWDGSRSVKTMNLNVNYNASLNKLQVKDTSVDFGGPKLFVKLDGKAPEDKSDCDIDFVMNVQLDKLPMDQFSQVWPKPVAPGARDWISASMSKGVFDHGEVKLNGKFRWNDLENVVLVSGEGKINARSGTIKYMEGMPAVENASADAIFDLDHMEVSLTNGNTGTLKIQPFTIKLTDFQQSVQYAEIPVKMAGPVKEVLRIIDSPPLGYAKAVGLKADDVDGNVEGVVEIKLPLLKDIALKDVGIKAEAKFSNFSAAKLVPIAELTEGAFDFSLDTNGFELKGPASFNKVPLQAMWRGVFSPQPGKPRYTATVSGSLTGEQFGLLGINVFSKSKGTSTLKVDYAQIGDKLSKIFGNIDFKQAGFFVDKLNWTKALGAAARLDFSVDIEAGKKAKVKSISLQGQQVNVKGSAEVNVDTGKIVELDLKPFVIGRTNAAVRIKAPVKNKDVVKIVAEGEALDISGFSSDKSKSDQVSDYTVKLNKLYTSDNGFISNVAAHARRDSIGWDEIDLHGMANGERQIYISLLPQTKDSNKKVFSIKCDSFGKLLSGMGFTDTIHNGAITIGGTSARDNPRAIEGEVNIGAFSVSGLPVLMRLLSAASPFGFADLVSGSSSFDHLKGKFRWYGDEIELKEVRASGSVYGVNVEGNVRLDGGDSNLHGTLVPFSFFNSVVNSIPLVGDIITGGEGQGVIAASYTIKGKLDDPDIGVNPVSLLTPGFLRNLFFSGDDDVPEPGANVLEETATGAVDSSGRDSKD